MAGFYLIPLSLFLCFFFAYHPIIYDLRDNVIGNELAHHAPLVVALSGLLVYLKRQRLRDMLAKSKDMGGAGLVPFLLGLCLNALGQAAGVYYLAQLSIPLTLYGMAQFLAGRDFAREMIFPLLFLLLAFPIPGKIYMSIVFPLKLMVTQASGVLLTLMGYSVKIYGNIIEIGSAVLGVIDACSGLNSLMAIVTLAIFYGYLVIRQWKYRLIIVLTMLPLIMAANVLRVTATAMIAAKWGSDAVEGQLHSLWGMAVFVIAVLGLLWITKIFISVEKRRSANG